MNIIFRSGFIALLLMGFLLPASFAKSTESAAIIFPIGSIVVWANNLLPIHNGDFTIEVHNRHQNVALKCTSLGSCSNAKQIVLPQDFNYGSTTLSFNISGSAVSCPLPTTGKVGVSISCAYDSDSLICKCSLSSN